MTSSIISSNESIPNFDQTKEKVQIVKISKLLIVFLLATLLVILSCFISANYIGTSALQLSNSIQHQKRLLISEQQNKIIGYFNYLLDLVSSMANILKITFQLTALLFIITDLVNFWNLASIYIFLPMQIPKFTKNILVNVWIQFNQPILSFFDIKFDTISFRQYSVDQNSDEQYKSVLNLDVSQIAFQPMIILCITAIQLFFMTMLLKWIKKSFRQIRGKVQAGVKIQQIFVNSLKDKEKHTNIFQFLIKSNKVEALPISHLKIQQQKKIQLQEESMKNIFLEESQIATNKRQIQQKYSSKDAKAQTVKHIEKKQQKQVVIHPQLKFMFLVHKLAQSNYNSQQKSKKAKHWSQTISVDQFQIISALIISFMPVLLLPLYNTLSAMKFISLKQKINFVIYYFILTVIFIYPFIYLTAKLSSGKRRFKKLKIQKNYQLKNKNNQNSRNNERHQDKFVKFSEIAIKQQAFQTFLLFFINMTIPICAGISSSPIWFLSINMIVHILFFMSTLTLFRKKSCKGKIKKCNNLIQQLTFLLYHLCFFIVYILNQMKESWIISGLIEENTVNQIYDNLGILIICIFTFGGLHQMLEFLLKIIFDVFKIIYMITHVIAGGYDVKQLQNQMKKNNRKNSEVKYCQILKKATKTNQFQKQEQRKTPVNTLRSLSELQVDFQIQIAKNEIILNQMKLQKLKHKENSNLSEIQQNQIHIIDVQNQNITDGDTSSFSKSQRDKSALCSQNRKIEQTQGKIKSINKVLPQRKIGDFSVHKPLSRSMKLKRQHTRDKIELIISKTII